MIRVGTMVVVLINLEIMTVIVKLNIRGRIVTSMMRILLEELI